MVYFGEMVKTGWRAELGWGRMPWCLNHYPCQILHNNFLVFSFPASTPSTEGNPCSPCSAHGSVSFQPFHYWTWSFTELRSYPCCLFLEPLKWGLCGASVSPLGTQCDHCFWKPRRHPPTYCSRQAHHGIIKNNKVTLQMLVLPPGYIFILWHHKTDR